MANDCDYLGRIYSKSKDAVEQFVNALNYKDFKNGYYMCCVFECDADAIHLDEDSGLYYCEVSGYCAWSVASCMINTDYGLFRGVQYGEPEFRVFRDFTGDLNYANIGVTASMLCRLLGCAFEVWGKEPLAGFQEHYVIKSNGDVIINEECHWIEGWDCDADGCPRELNPEKDEGGFGEDWGFFGDGADIIMDETAGKED